MIGKKIDWGKIRRQFEGEMTLKLRDLPGHREIPENLKDFRHLISHEFPETTPAQMFKELISFLLEQRQVDLLEIKNKYLYPQLKREKETLDKFKKEFKELKKSARQWIETNLSEEELKYLWREHKTWLPRRYVLYKDKKVSFQEIAADTLARYALIKMVAVRPTR